MLTPLRKHRVEGHDGNDYDVKCTILAIETDISSRKALEAFWISARNPTMNNRSECVSLTNELLLYAPHCELSE